MPGRIAAHCQIERRQLVLPGVVGEILAQLRHVAGTVQLREDDRLAGAVEPPRAQRGDVVEAEHVARGQTPRPDGGNAELREIVEPCDAVDDLAQRRAQNGVMVAREELTPAGHPVAGEAHAEETLDRLRASVEKCDAVTACPARLEIGKARARERRADKRGIELAECDRDMNRRACGHGTESLRNRERLLQGHGGRWGCLRQRSCAKHGREEQKDEKAASHGSRSRSS